MSYETRHGLAVYDALSKVEQHLPELLEVLRLARAVEATELSKVSLGAFEELTTELSLALERYDSVLAETKEVRARAVSADGNTYQGEKGAE